MSKPTELNEDAAAGSTSAGNIASNYSAHGETRQRDKGGEHEWHRSVADRKSPEGQRREELRAKARKNLDDAKAKMKKKKGLVGRFKSFLSSTNESVFNDSLVLLKPATQFKISESFNMQDVVSRLKGVEHSNNPAPNVSYGVEDDSGNMMKITVKSDDSKDFESALATALSDAQDYKKVTGETRELSMAELLFNLKDKFDILDVEFPTIPKDAIYNADKVTYGDATGTEQGMGAGGPDDLLGDPNGAPPPDDGMIDGLDPNAPKDGSMPPPVGPDGLPAPDAAGGMGNPEGVPGEAGEPPIGGEMGDDASVSDFPPDTGETDEKSLIISVLNMLKADAEAKIAVANAEAEKARALQAQYSKEAAEGQLSREEENARLEAEMDRQKDKEKEAKKMADLARFRVNSMGENTKPRFGTFLMEFVEQGEDLNSLTKAKQALNQQYMVVQGDDPETIQYKRAAFVAATREIDAKIALARLTANFKQKQDAKQQQQQNPQNNQQPNQNNQQNPQNNQAHPQQQPNPSAPGTNTQSAVAPSNNQPVR
jgi:hypothetical protein